MKSCRENQRPVRDNLSVTYKRSSGAGLILLILICAACSRKDPPSLQPTEPSARYVESVNTTSGTLTIDAQFNEDKKPSVINFSNCPR